MSRAAPAPLPAPHAILARYDLGMIHAVTPLRGGRMAQSWHVRAATGEFVLRRAEPDLPGRLPLLQRQQFLRHLAAHLPESPHLCPNARGETLTEIAGERYEILTFIAGETRDEALGVATMPAETLAAAGDLLARYHHAVSTATFAPPYAEDHSPSRGDEIAARWQRLQARLSGCPSSVLPELRGPAAATLAEWVRSLCEFWSSTVWHSLALPQLWAHGDFTPYNLVYRDGLPIGLLDFGAVQWAPAAYDLAVAMLSFPGPHAVHATAGERAGERAGAREGESEGGREGETGRSTEPGWPELDRPSPPPSLPLSLARSLARSLAPSLSPSLTPSLLAAYHAARPLSDAERSALPLLMRHRRAIAVLWIAEQCLAGRDDLRAKLPQYLAEPPHP